MQKPQISEQIFICYHRLIKAFEAISPQLASPLPLTFSYNMALGQTLHPHNFYYCPLYGGLSEPLVLLSTFPESSK